MDWKSTILLLSAAYLVGCDVARVAHDTRDLVSDSNGLQKQLLDYMRKTYELTEELKRSTAKTETGVHLQILTISLKEMFAPENIAVIVPPTRMMPYAETFAAESTEFELIRMSHLLFQEAIQNSGGDGDDLGPQQRNGRLARLTGMGLLAAFCSMDKFVRILKYQIDDKGRYEETTYAFATGRYIFIRDFLLNPILEARILNLGSLIESLDYFYSLLHLATLPYSSSLEINIPSLEVAMKVDYAELKRLARKAKRRFTDKLQKPLLETPLVQDLLKHFDL